MPLELLKSKTGRTLIHHVILSGAKNPYHDGRDPSVAKSTLPQGDITSDMTVVNS